MKIQDYLFVLLVIVLAGFVFSYWNESHPINTDGPVIEFPQEKDLRLSLDRVKHAAAKFSNNKEAVEATAQYLADNDASLSSIENYVNRRPCNCCMPNFCRCHWGESMYFIGNKDEHDLEYDPEIFKVKELKGMIIIESIVPTEKDTSSFIKIGGDSIRVWANNHEVKIKLD